jgi:GPH family glycoside/pentoside/hexuronide:cation symporter
MPPGFQFSWLLVFLLLSTIGTTVFGVPYLALGLESPSSEKARTEWQGWRSLYHKLSGVLVQWLFWMISLPVFASPLWGARIVGFWVGLVIMITGVIPAIFVSEREEPVVKSSKGVPLLKSWTLTMKDRNFLVLACVSILIFSSILLVGQLGFFLAVFYVFEGDKLEASFYIAIGGTAFHLVGIGSIPWITKLSEAIGKRKAFQICTASIAIGGLAKIVCFVPGAGIWMALPSVFLAPGLVAVLVLLPSMLADVAAADERRRLSSRQGMYAASMTWVNKLAQSGIVAVSGLVLLWAGWKNALGADQTPETFQNMRWAFALGTILLALIAAAILCLYNLKDPDTQKRKDLA